MDTESYLEQLKNRYTDRESMGRALELDEGEKAFFTGRNEDISPPVAVTPYYLSLIGEGPYDPIRKQCIPSVEETDTKDYELTDPLGEELFSPRPRLVHRYPDRVLILVTDQCAVYCRHCFRRSFTGKTHGPLSSSQLDEIADYIADRKEIHEVLLSGGDPLILSDGMLERILSRLREIRPSLVLRLATRIPVVLPMRISTELVKMLGTYRPLWIVTQFNHPVEITAQSARAVRLFTEAGLSVLNQTVLLKDINDDVPTLEALFHKLLEIQCKPYYLFQGDLARGTSHFRVPLSRGLTLVRCVKENISGLAMPKYALDLPGGGGKTTLNESVLSLRKGEWYVFRGYEGQEYRYPEEA